MVLKSELVHNHPISSDYRSYSRNSILLGIDSKIVKELIFL